MCGITGFFGVKGASEKAKKSLLAIQNRGIDGAGIATERGVVFASSAAALKTIKARNALGHCLHSVVGAVKQPLKQKGFFAANCEIYNWKALCKKHSASAGNDAELLLGLIEKNGLHNFLKTLEELDGVWAFAYWKGNNVFLSRDILGEKPLWFSIEKGLAFASEKKALEAAGCRRIVELNPRHSLVFDLKTKKARFLKREFFQIENNSFSPEQNESALSELLNNAVGKRLPEAKFGLLFSGGIDSVLLAMLLKRTGAKFKCFFGFVEGLGEAKDLEFAKSAAKTLSLELEVVSVGIKEIPGVLEKIVPLIESSNPIKVGVALPLHLACTRAKEMGVRVIFSGLGADELFCGYARFRESNNPALDSKNLLLQMHENDLYRDDVLTMNNNIELRTPFLDNEIIRFALSLPEEQKITAQGNKIVLRRMAHGLGLPKEFAERKKLAAQYGSNFDKAIEKLAKQAGAKGKADYLSRFAAKKNLKLAALFSGGKDSCLALWIMQRQNYDVCCLVSIIPKKHDSFMYHKPDEKIVKLQSKALNIPLLIKKTSAEKEKELSALKGALAEAKKRFGIEGVVSGALYSNYQRERIQKICDGMQLKLFSPLWHKKQGDELRELVDNGFVFIFTKIAALGFNEGWLGKQIGRKEIIELEELNARIGLNVAGEGGEFESVVLDAPNFKKIIKIVFANKKMQNEFTGVLEIKKAVLERKP